MLRAGGRRATCSLLELRRRVSGFAAAASNTPPQSTVLIRLGQSIDFAAAFLGTIAAGRIAVPISPQLTAREVQWILQNSGARLSFADPDLPFPDAPRIRPAEIASGGPESFADAAADDPAFLVYTSGTSGTPRGVLHAHRNIDGRRPMVPGWTLLSQADRVFHAGALNWTYTLGAGLMDPLRERAAAVLCETPADPGEYLRIIQEERITVFAAVPGLYRKILKHANPGSFNLSTLRVCLAAGSALPSQLAEEWREKTGCEICEALGMSEISTYISTAPGTRKPGSPGRVQPGRTVRLFDAESGTFAGAGRGILAVHKSDPGLMLGYWKNDELTQASFRDDFFLTGDVARIDEEGFVWYEGRSDEMMNALGYRVSPLEIETVLLAHEAVLDAAAAEVEVPGKDITIIAAFVVLRPGFDESARPSILEYASGLLARYKMPRELVVVKELPRNANGKLARKSLSLPRGPA